MTSSFLNVLERPRSFRHDDNTKRINDGDEYDASEAAGIIDSCCRPKKWNRCPRALSSASGMSGSGGCGCGYYGQPPKQPTIKLPTNQSWTASQRVHRISQDRNLQTLLTAEVKKSGYVTTAGYKAVLQNFIYSDAVEKEMNDNNRHVETMDDSDRSFNFASMITGMTASTVSMTASLTASNLSLPTLTATHVQRQTKSNLFQYKRSSTGSSTALHTLRRPRSSRTSSNFSTFDDASVLTTNLAPRRPSEDNPIALLIGEEQAPTSSCQQCTKKSSKDNKIQFGQVVFDPKCVTAARNKDDNNTVPKRIECSKEEVLPTAVTRKLDGGRSANAEELIQCILDSDKDGWCQWSSHHDDDNDDDCSSNCSSISSHHDCGWLPWPDTADDDGGGDTATQCIIDDNISSNYSKEEENASFVPWPDTTSIKNVRCERAGHSLGCKMAFCSSK